MHDKPEPKSGVTWARDARRRLRTLLRARAPLQASALPSDAPDRDALARVLGLLPAVCECVVRMGPSGRATAYVVPARLTSNEEICRLVARTLPGVMADDFVLLDRLPRDASGALDEEALRALPVGLDELAVRVERQLGSPSCGRVAALVVPCVPTMSRLHVDDLGLVSPGEELCASRSEAGPEAADHPLCRRALSEAAALTFHPDAPTTLPEALEAAARRFHGPRMLHITDDGGEHPLSLAALLDDARRIQAGLEAHDVRPARFVILQLTDTRDLLACFWGALFASAIPVIVPVPVSYAQATGDRDKLAHVHALLGAPLVVTNQTLRSAFEAFARDRAMTDADVVSIETLRRYAPALQRGRVEPDDVAFLSLSSGSTGAPKCIQLTHRNILARGRGASALCGQSEDDVVLNWLPFDHIGSISDWHLRCVDLGCHMVYCTKERVLGRPLAWLDLIERHRVTHSWAPNFAYALVNAALDEAPAGARWDLSSLEFLLTAGEAVASSTVEALLLRLSGHGLARTAVRPAFGMAELGSGITYFEPSDPDSIQTCTVDRASLGGPLREVPRGHPRGISFACLGPVIAGMAMRIVDAERRVLSEGRIGHLHVRGQALSPGYYRNDEANRVFLDDGWFDTGDQGFLLAGRLYLTGRSKDCIIIDGANYFPAEVESAAEEARGLSVSFTAAHTVRPHGCARECLALFFVPSSDRDDDLVRVIRAIQERVAHKVKVKPDYFVPLAAHDVPKTAIGKIQRKELAARFEAGLYRDVVRRVDLLLENERTLPDFFARVSHRPNLRPGSWEAAPLPCIVLGQTADQARALSSPALRARACFLGHDLATGQLAALLAGLAHEAPRIAVLDVRALAAADDPRARPPALLSLLRTLGRSHGPAQIELTVATRCAQPIAPDHEVDPWAAQLPPLLLAASRAAAWLSVRCVDFGSPAATEHEATSLGEELAAPFSDGEVAYRDGQRFTPALCDVSFSDEPFTPRLARGGLVLVVGGLGGIGRLLSRRLLTRHGVSLLIVGRLPLSSAMQEEFERLSALGSVQYEALDGTRSDALETAVRAAERARNTSLIGAFHLAGIAREGDVFEETDEGLVALGVPKLGIAQALTPVLLARPGAFVVHASSLESSFPSASTGAYAAACRALEAWSHHERTRLGLASFSCAFSAWQGVGMSRAGAHHALLGARGMLVLQPEQALTGLEALLGRAPDAYAMGVSRQALVVRARMQGPVTPLFALRAFAEREDRSHVDARDREGRPVRVPVQRVTDMPLTDGGELAREALAALVTGSASYVAPEGELERELCGMFQRLLGVERVGVRDGFFDLGGTSLSALRLFGMIEARYGKKLPAATLYDAPTVRALASLVASVTPPQGHDSVFPLTPVTAGPALFLVHDADGETVLYGNLARLLEAELPVYAIRPEGRDGVVMVQTRIEDMASHYAEKIRALQPEGPYFLGGLCSGGVVAFAIAQKLEAQGQRVGLVALLDSADAQAEPRSLAEARGGRFLAVLRNPGISVSSKLRKAGEKLRNVAVYETRRRSRHGLDRASFLLLRACVDRGLSLPSVLRRVTPRMIYHFAHREYEPGVLAGPLTLFRASERLIVDEPGLDDTPAREQYVDPMLGWRARSPRLDLVESPGGHSSMLREPQVSGLAEALRDRIREARTERDLPRCPRQMT